MRVPFYKIHTDTNFALLTCAFHFLKYTLIQTSRCSRARSIFSKTHSFKLRVAHVRVPFSQKHTDSNFASLACAFHFLKNTVIQTSRCSRARSIFSSNLRRLSSSKSSQRTPLIGITLKKRLIWG